MMKHANLKCRILLIITLFVSLILSGCAESLEEPGYEDPVALITGTIYRIENEKILVVDGLDDVNIPYAEWFAQGRRAVFFSLTDDTIITSDNNQVDLGFLRRGQKVEVYHAGFLAESYPEQGYARQINVTCSASAEPEQVDSGRFARITVEHTLEIKISGIPDGLSLREYALTNEAAKAAENLLLEIDDVIIIRFISHDQFDGLIFDVERIIN